MIYGCPHKKMPNRFVIRSNLGSYPITWLRSVSGLFLKVKQKIEKRRAILVTNQTIYKLYEKKITNEFLKRDVLVIPDGEDQKKLCRIESLANQLISLGVDRKSVLIAFGGGVVGDITGFLASIYMRGIPYIQIPTTLLSMVDSSVGGKNGVNSNLGKNMIGTFYQPESVWICVDFLETLPDREFRCGLAEAVKSALIHNKKFYSFISQKADLISKKDFSVLHSISYQSIAVKRWFVQKDEKESSLRAILNLGHTLAHALEKYFEYKFICHGEAVSIGICFAAFYSFKKGFIPESQWKEIQELLDRLDLPTKLRDVNQQWMKSKNEEMPNIDTLVDYMKNDKKNQEGSIFFIFLKKIGECFLPQKIEIKEMHEMLNIFSTYK